MGDDKRSKWLHKSTAAAELLSMSDDLPGGTQQRNWMPRTNKERLVFDQVTLLLAVPPYALSVCAAPVLLPVLPGSICCSAAPPCHCLCCCSPVCCWNRALRR